MGWSKLGLTLPVTISVTDVLLKVEYSSRPDHQRRGSKEGGTETFWDVCIFGLEAHLVRNVTAHRRKYPREVPPRPSPAHDLRRCRRLMGFRVEILNSL